ncbi:MAG: pyridoxal-phosphate dependent enzyme, partial [Anaerolineales bacterium]
SYAAREVGIPATVCLSEEVPENKVMAIEALGAEVVIYGESQDAAYDRALELHAERGLIMVPPFDDPHVIAGQGTIGLELLEQLPDLDTALVPLSGGGLISGIALALKSASPGIRVLGVSMARAPVMYHSLKAGKPIQMDEQDTLADSLRGGIGLNNQYTFPMVQELVDDVILVSEDEIAAAMSFAFYEHHLVLEGAGAVGIAALLSQRVKNTKGNIAVILSGGNVAIDSFLELIHPH